MSDQLGQGGKDITIYVDYNPTLSINDWVNVLNTVTHALAQARIKPGYQILSSYIRSFPNFDKNKNETKVKTVLDKPEHLTRSPYVYYRFDETHKTSIPVQFKRSLRKIAFSSDESLVPARQYKNIDEVSNKSYTKGEGDHVKSVNTP